MEIDIEATEKRIHQIEDDSRSYSRFMNKYPKWSKDPKQKRILLSRWCQNNRFCPIYKSNERNAK
jgi:hypothetical protein